MKEKKHVVCNEVVIPVDGTVAAGFINRRKQKTTASLSGCVTNTRTYARVITNILSGKLDCACHLHACGRLEICQRLSQEAVGTVQVYILSASDKRSISSTG